MSSVSRGSGRARSVKPKLGNESFGLGHLGRVEAEKRSSGRVTIRSVRSSGRTDGEDLERSSPR